jgi:hypothetical protein
MEDQRLALTDNYAISKSFCVLESHYGGVKFGLGAKCWLSIRVFRIAAQLLYNAAETHLFLGLVNLWGLEILLTRQ